MREIKFRVWSKKYPCMWYYPDFSLNRILDEKNDWEILMQYTGLKDKNGKEIYEGDIVKGKPEIKYKDATEIYEPLFKIEWFDNESAFGFEEITIVGQKERFFYQTSANRYEVIGNIYENPELIKER